MDYLVVKHHWFGEVGEKHNRVARRESGLSYMLAPTTMSDGEIREAWVMTGNDDTAYRCGHEHDCCACLFYSNIRIDRSGSRVIVRQLFGINI